MRQFKGYRAVPWEQGVHEVSWRTLNLYIYILIN